MTRKLSSDDGHKSNTADDGHKSNTADDVSVITVYEAMVTRCGLKFFSESEQVVGVIKS